VRAGEPGEESGLADAKEERRVVRGFRVAYVWDISATDGEDLPDVRPVALEGEAPDHLYERLAEQVATAGYRLERGDCAPANGCTDFLARTVTVRPDLSGAGAAKTLCHELAHVTLHAELAGTELGRQGCRGRAEVEAESVAYLVCAMAGMETGSYSFPYVARWASDLSVVSDTAARVTTCARDIAAVAGLFPTDPRSDPPAQARSRSMARSRRTDRPRLGAGRGR
jgi:hypothetical protein